MIPRGMPISSQSTAEPIASEIVTGSRSRMMLSTGSWFLNE